MIRFKDWPISRKLMCAFCLSAAFTAVLGTIGYTRMKQMQDETARINQDVVPVLSRLSELRGYAGEFRVYEVGQFVNFDDPERFARFFTRMDEIHAQYAATQKALAAKIGPDSPLRADFLKLTDASDRYFEANVQLRQLLAQPDRAPAMAFSSSQSGRSAPSCSPRSTRCTRSSRPRSMPPWSPAPPRSAPPASCCWAAPC